MQNRRNDLIDIIKGFAIITVVFGHCIQFGSGQQYLSDLSFFYDKIYKIIYSWHMPLFMIISGYLFAFSIQKYNVMVLIRRRVMSLIIPIFSWSILISVLLLVIKYNDKSLFIIWGEQFFLSIWFLWAVFYNSVVVLLVHKFGGDDVKVYFIIFISLFFLPDAYNAYLYKFMYPFFVVPYLWKTGKIGFMDKIMDLCSTKALFGFLFILYIVLLYLYDFSTYIYTSGYLVVSNWQTFSIEYSKLWNDLHRMAIGFCGSAVCIIFLKYIYGKSMGLYLWRFFSRLGVASLAIYIISGYIMPVLKKMTVDFSQNYMINLVETIIILLVSFIMYNIVSKFKFTNKYFWGGR